MMAQPGAGAPMPKHGEAIADGDGAGDYMRSKMAAMPWPPPMHMVTSA